MEGEVVLAVPGRPLHVNRFALVNRLILMERAKVDSKEPLKPKAWLKPSEIAGARPEFLPVALMVKAARVRLHLTQGELAEKAGCTNTVISLVETAQRGPGPYGPGIFAALGIEV